MAILTCRGLHTAVLYDDALQSRSPSQSLGSSMPTSIHVMTVANVMTMHTQMQRACMYLQLLPEGDTLQRCRPSQFLGSSMGSNELLVRHFEATDLPGQCQGTLLVVGIEDVFQKVGVEVGLDVAVTLLNGCLNALGPAGVCCT